MNASDIKMIKALALDYVEGERGLRHEKEVASLTDPQVQLYRSEIHRLGLFGTPAERSSTEESFMETAARWRGQSIEDEAPYIPTGAEIYEAHMSIDHPGVMMYRPMGPLEAMVAAAIALDGPQAVADDDDYLGVDEYEDGLFVPMWLVSAILATAFWFIVYGLFGGN